MCSVVEKLAEPGKHYFPYSGTHGVIYMLPLRAHIDVLRTSSRRYSEKVPSTIVGNSIVVTVADLASFHLHFEGSMPNSACHVSLEL